MSDRQPPYEMERVRGGYEVFEPVTGFRTRHRLVGNAMAEMHRLLIDRRAELRARASLDEQEERELERLERYTDFFLYGGLQCAMPAA